MIPGSPGRPVRDCLRLHSESVIKTGKVRVRPSKRTKRSTHAYIEVLADKLEVLNHADVLLFTIDDPEVAAKVNSCASSTLPRSASTGDDPRTYATWRVATATRVFMEEQGFLEIETTLTKSTPEGAGIPRPQPNPRRPVLRPAPVAAAIRISCAGVDKFPARLPFDEDLRADRQLEFTQVDIEMSFIERDIGKLIEGLLKRVGNRARHRHASCSRK